MNKKPIQLIWLLLLAGLLACAKTASAQSQFYWDATNPINNSPGSGGSGNWSSTNADWWVVGAADSDWTNGSYANFEGTAGTVTVTAAVTANGINFATNGYTVGGSATLTLAGTPTITLPNSGTNTMSCPIAGTVPVTVSGSGLLVLTHANTSLIGGMTINPGATVVRTTANAAGTNTIIDNGTIDDTITGATAFGTPITGGSSSVINTSWTFNSGSENIRYINAALANFNGTLNIIAGLSGGLPGAGQIIMTNVGGPSMTWNVGAGATLLLNTAAPFQANVIILNGRGNSQPYGALRLDAVTLQANVLLNGANITIGDNNSSAVSQITGVISDNGQHLGYTRVVAGKTIILSGANTYTGPTILSAGIQQVASPEIPGTSGPLGASPASNPGSIVMSGGVLQYSSANSNDYSGRFSAAAGATYDIDVNGQGVTFATPLTSSGGSLTLSDTAGGGTLTLGTNNTYNGITTINSGTLNISGSIAGTAVNVNGGTLELSKTTALPHGAILTLPSSPNSGMVNLNFNGTQTITTLNFGGSPQPPGTYGASDNPNVLYPNSAFVGNGILNVQPPTYWDANGTDALNQTNADGGGSGNWDNTTSNWWQSGNSDIRWTPNNVATFAGTPGTVTLAASVTADGLTFDASGYDITNSGNSALTLGGTPIVTIPSGTAEIDCTIAGTAGLTLNGSGGTLTLDGNNTYVGQTVIGDGGNALILNGSNAYTGATTIGSSGSLTVGNSGNLAGGNYPGAIVNNGAFTYGSSTPQTLSGIISGGGTLTQNGPGSLTLTGLSTFSGGININSGTLAVSGLADLGNNPTFNTGGYGGAINDNGQFIFNSTTTQTLSGGINGTGSLVQSGSGTLTLSGDDGYYGSTTVSSNSVLVISGSGVLGDGDYQTNIVNDGTFNYSSFTSQQFAGPISGKGVLILGNSSIVTLIATNSYTGGTSIGTGCSLTIGDPGVLGDGTYASSVTNTGTLTYSSSAAQILSGPISGSGGSLVQNGPGTLTLTGTNSFTGVMNIGQGAALIINGSGKLGNGNYAAAITDSGALVYNSSAAQTLSGAISDNGTGGTLTQTGAGMLILTGGNTYTGTTTIGSGSVLVVAGAGFLNNGDYETNIVDDGSFAYDSSTAQTLSGVISGTGSLGQIGSGTLTLTGSNSYTGATVVSNGVLALSGSGSISNSTSVSIGAGATFDVSGLVSPYIFSSASFSAAGNATAAAIINGAGGGTVNLGSQPVSLTFAPQTFNGDASHPALNVSQGSLTLNGNTITINNAGASPLGAGTYSLIQVAGGTINGTAHLGGVTGKGLQSNASASLSVSGGSLNLVVVGGVPSPGISSVSVSGGKLVFSGTNGPDNGTYVVLKSTNLQTPISQWTPVSTNNFSGTGTFSATNTIGGGQDFFIIKVTSP